MRPRVDREYNFCLLNQKPPKNSNNPKYLFIHSPYINFGSGLGETYSTRFLRFA